MKSRCATIATKSRCCSTSFHEESSSITILTPTSSGVILIFLSLLILSIRLHLFSFQRTPYNTMSHHNPVTPRVLRGRPETHPSNRRHPPHPRCSLRTHPPSRIRKPFIRKIPPIISSQYRNILPRHTNLHHKTSGLFQLFCLLYLLDSSNNIFVLSMYLIVVSIRIFLIF